MKKDANPNLFRRHFLKKRGQALSVSTLTGVTLPHVHAAGSDSIQLPIIGCGSRGSDAIANALQATNSNANLVAMADLYEDRLQCSHLALYDKFQQRISKPFNQAKRAAHSNLAAIMGRAAMHMGKEITWDEAINSNFQWFSDIDKLPPDSTPPVKADEDGQYPVPDPGEWVEI